MDQSMRPIGFVICCINWMIDFTKDKIYTFYAMDKIGDDLDYYVSLKNDFGQMIYEKRMFLGFKKNNNQHHFEFYHYPEFPKDVSEWTEDDWFQYDLKYGS